MKRALERAKNKGKVPFDGGSKKVRAQLEKKEPLDGSDNTTKARKKVKY
jgi:hypothetical protein